MEAPAAWLFTVTLAHSLPGRVGRHLVVGAAVVLGIPGVAWAATAGEPRGPGPVLFGLVVRHPGTLFGTAALPRIVSYPPHRVTPDHARHV